MGELHRRARIALRERVNAPRAKVQVRDIDEQRAHQGQALLGVERLELDAIGEAAEDLQRWMLERAVGLDREYEQQAVPRSLVRERREQRQ